MWVLKLNKASLQEQYVLLTVSHVSSLSMYSFQCTGKQFSRIVDRDFVYNDAYLMFNLKKSPLRRFLQAVVWVLGEPVSSTS